eukprot:10977256-Prorocentrum_lima.AAC.1
MMKAVLAPVLASEMEVGLTCDALPEIHPSLGPLQMEGVCFIDMKAGGQMSLVPLCSLGSKEAKKMAMQLQSSVGQREAHLV